MTTLPDNSTDRNEDAYVALQRLNELVLERISECGEERTILGFLPFSLKEEDQLIETARNILNDTNMFLRKFL